jgi:RNA polymerase sigma-70 factor (ECF subfamily)
VLKRRGASAHVGETEAWQVPAIEEDIVVGRNIQGGVGGADFTVFFARYHLPLTDYLYGMTRDRDLAADLAQETFLRAYVAAPQLANIAHPKAWLYRIATNIALNAARHRGHFQWLPLSHAETEAASDAADGAWAALQPIPLPQLTVDDLASTVSEREVVWQVLAELPPRWRATLLLQTAAGFHVDEIAVLLGLSQANVRKCLFRAKERFRSLYRDLAARGV